MLAQALAQYINDSQLGVYDQDGVGGNVFLEYQPDTPDDAITIYTTGGLPADVSTSIRRPGAQILVRGVGGAIVVGAIAETLHRLFDSRTSVILSDDTRVMLCQCKQSEPICLGADDNGRLEYSINLQFITGGN